MDLVTFHERWTARLENAEARVRRYKRAKDEARSVEHREQAEHMLDLALRKLDTLNALRDDLHDLDLFERCDLSTVMRVRVMCSFDAHHGKMARVLDVREDHILVRFDHDGSHDWIKPDRVVPVLAW